MRPLKEAIKNNAIGAGIPFSKTHIGNGKYMYNYIPGANAVGTLVFLTCTIPLFAVYTTYASWTGRLASLGIGTLIATASLAAALLKHAALCSTSCCYPPKQNIGIPLDQPPFPIKALIWCCCSCFCLPGGKSPEWLLRLINYVALAAISPPEFENYQKITEHSCLSLSISQQFCLPFILGSMAGLASLCTFGAPKIYSHWQSSSPEKMALMIGSHVTWLAISALLICTTMAASVVAQKFLCNRNQGLLFEEVDSDGENYYGHMDTDYEKEGYTHISSDETELDDNTNENHSFAINYN